ncbi:MAG: tryptophan synthase subunit alpha [Candidatus Goldbacteria bacterium]|nr:tryptophan synthase subunit alpha [Candidatus Goldiibacteriota bacterium]
MENRIEKILKDNSKKVVIYTMAGYPDLETTKQLIKLLDTVGVSLIELGIPFSDPVADGPVIQSAGEVALKRGTTIKKIFKLVREIRNDVKIPIVVMTYYNIIFNYGKEKFIKDAVKAGIDGAIIPDLPFDEEVDFYNYAKKSNFYIIYLVAPTNTITRAEKIVEKSMGFVYYILLRGVTGVRNKNESDLNRLIELKKSTDKPFFAGFGISKPQQARMILKYADGVIIGSAFIDEISKYIKNKSLLLKKAKKFIKEFINEAKKAS